MRRQFMYFVRHAALAIAVLSFLFSACHSGQSGAATLPPSDEDHPTAYFLTYDIDRTNVPDLYYNELTLRVQVNDAQTIDVRADGEPVSFVHDADAGQIMLTTGAARVEVQVAGVGNPYGVGEIKKAALRNDKGFAWSHGMDDNVYLRAQVAVLEQYDWRGTFFLIAGTVDDARDEEWIADVPYVRRKLADGWSIGSHDWDGSCREPIDVQKMIDAAARLNQIVATSTVPTHRVISFAAPCFLASYHPLVLAQRDAEETSILFNESGDVTPMIVDAAARAPVTGDSEHDILAYDFDFDGNVGRGTELAFATQEALDTIDWMAARHAQTGEHFWYNTLSHGNEEAALATFAAHVYSEYGPEGTNEVWVAPSDEIYSYLLTRDRSVITTTANPPVPELFRIQLPLVTGR